MLDPSHPISELLRRDSRYHFDAYVFVFDALRYAQDKLKLGQVQTSEGDSGEGDDRHVTGQELCEAIRQFALEQYGLMAQRVLNHWGIKETGDFGEIVFNLIEIGQMKKTPHDRREDFDAVFDFNEGLRNGFEIRLPKSSKERRS